MEHGDLISDGFDIHSNMNGTSCRWSVRLSKKRQIGLGWEVSCTMDFKPNKDWERKMANVKVSVPPNATPKQKADALAKEMKRRGLTK